MTHASSQDVGAILDHYADVIEGGNAYNGGTAYYGIPGRYSNTQWLRDGTYSTLTSGGNGTTTTIVMANTTVHPANRWVRDKLPSYYALCTSATNAANTNKARRITAWTANTYTFTVQAFDAATQEADEFDVLEGFKRVPNGLDINDADEGQAAGYDRFFDLELMPIRALGWYGAGQQTWEGTLTVVLRLLKHARVRDWRRSFVENLTIIGNVMSSNQSGQEHRDSTYVRTLEPPQGAPEVRVNDRAKIVAALDLRIRYRVQRGL
jgi:hypothetical protein